MQHCAKSVITCVQCECYAADGAAMRAALAQPRASDDDRIATGFALARALDEQGRSAESLDALAAANALAGVLLWSILRS